MSTVKRIDVKINEGKRDEKKVNVCVEYYKSAQDIVNDCNTKSVKRYDDRRNARMSMGFEGVNNYDEALNLLQNGYQPSVDKMKVALKQDSRGESKRIGFENNVHGFAPIVPLAMKGVPNSMVNMTMKPVKFKVVDVYYDIGTPGYVGADSILEAGQKLLGAVIALEKRGYRFNLYAIDTYNAGSKTDILVLKVKSSDRPLDLKRISFPTTHPAYARVISMDWQSKSDVARNICSGRGYAMTTEYSDKEANEMIKKVFGENSVYIACNRIIEKDENYIKEVLVK